MFGVFRPADSLSPAPDAGDLVLADDLFAAVGSLRRHSRRVGGRPLPAGFLSGAEAELVALVRRRPGVCVAEAADELALAPNTVSTLVGQLVCAGVLTRVSDPRDRRFAALTLTASVRELVDRWRDQRACATAGVIGELDGTERADLARALPVIARIAAALSRLPEDSSYS
jgi:DNA-binding MarR family transcriptional regulator